MMRCWSNSQFGAGCAAKLSTTEGAINSTLFHEGAKSVAHVKKSQSPFAILAMDKSSVCDSNQLHEIGLLLSVQFPAPLLAIAGNDGRR